MDKASREFVAVFKAYQGCTEAEAIKALKAMSKEGQQAVLAQIKLEARGQQRLPMAMSDPTPAPRAKKVSYSLLLPPEMLEAVKAAADRDGSSASQFIRTAIARQLGRVK